MACNGPACPAPRSWIGSGAPGQFAVQGGERAPRKTPKRPVYVKEDPDHCAPFIDELQTRSSKGDVHARRLLKSIDHAYDLIHNDFMHGEVVPVPADKRFEGVTNLRCEDLHDWHRLLYTIIGSPDSVQCLVICVIDHKEYDKLFGIRKK